MKRYRNLWRSFDGCQSTVSLTTRSTIYCSTGWCVAFAMSRCNAGFWPSQISHLRKPSELSQSAEAAEKNARELQASPKPKGPSFVGYHQSPRSKGPLPPSPCYRCGDKQHSAQDRRFKSAECHHCRKKDHIAKVCHSKDKRGQPHKGPVTTSKPA